MSDAAAPMNAASDAANGRSRLGGAVSSVIWNIVVLAAALIAWQILTLVVNSAFFPGPATIVRAFIDLAINGDTGGVTLWEHSLASVERVLVGFGFACL